MPLLAAAGLGMLGSIAASGISKALGFGKGGYIEKDGVYQ